MSRPRCALLLFGVVILIAASAVPAEDLPETPYDESAPLVYMGVHIAPFVPPESVREELVVPGTVSACLTGKPAERFRPPQQRVCSIGTRSARPLDHIVLWNFCPSNSLIISNHSLRC
jgi:hypothetical protein